MSFLTIRGAATRNAFISSLLENASTTVVTEPVTMGLPNSHPQPGRFNSTHESIDRASHTNPRSPGVYRLKGHEEKAQAHTHH